LGQAPQRFRSAETIYAALVALEREATGERRAELMLEAKFAGQGACSIFRRDVQRVVADFWIVSLRSLVALFGALNYFSHIWLIVSTGG
jgi:hypothetical protein